MFPQDAGISLQIETSSERGLASILDGTSVLFTKDLPFGLSNSKYLVPAIHEGFKALGISAKDLQYVGVGIGPGSYTGIRVGAMTAKSIAYSCKIPLIGIGTLSTFVPDTDGPFAAIIDAKIGGAYILKGIKKNGIITYSTQPQVCEIDQLLVYLNDVSVLVTPNSTMLRPKLESLFPQKSWDWQELGPNPSQMGKISLEMYQKGEVSMDGRLELMYLRKTQAELERDKH